MGGIHRVCWSQYVACLPVDQGDCEERAVGRIVWKRDDGFQSKARKHRKSNRQVAAMMQIQILRWEWPPWKTFARERREIFDRFERAASEAEMKASHIRNLEHRALQALQERDGRVA